MALFMLPNQYFRGLVTYLHAAFGAFLAKCRAPIKRWILDEYEQQKADVRAQLYTTRDNSDRLDSWYKQQHPRTTPPSIFFLIREYNSVQKRAWVLRLKRK